MEAEFHRWLSQHVPAHPSLPLGLADDAAVLKRSAPPDLVITTDLLSDGVDFRLAEIDPRGAGRKALAVNLSDLAAMAARPVAAFVSLAVPRTGCGIRSRLELAQRLYEGLLPLAREFGVALAGGDTNTHDGPTVISITAIGEVGPRGPLTRSGGRAGDKLLVTGALGGSIGGHHLDFMPRVREALLLMERYELHAGMDVSDGLALDASRLAAASGCGAVIELEKIPIAAAARGLSDPVSNALGDGEDFELLIAAPPEVACMILTDQSLDCGVACIGELTERPDLWYQAPDGSRVPATPIGWQH